MPRQPSGGRTSLKPAFKSVGSSCCPHIRENGPHIFAKHDLETAQEISRSFGKPKSKKAPSSLPSKSNTSKTTTFTRQHPHHQALLCSQKLTPLFL
ncbi:MAG: hypothetical protein K940chlam9_01845 [Chlamydiae bacterium]|nr:hypothetical protein [Chlamydiota bacterium]